MMQVACSKKWLTSGLLVVGLMYNLSGQACCSGGTPLSGIIGLEVRLANSGVFELINDYNVQSDLVSHSTKLGDNPRRRSTHSLLSSITYSPSDAFSIVAVASWVRQVELIDRPNGQKAELAAQGMGDAILFGQYALFQNRMTPILLGAGLKIPVGSTRKRDEIFGLDLHPDLQPGTGSWDVLLAAGISISPAVQNELTLTSNLVYRLTAPADRYAGQLEYEFGNELRWLSGLSRGYPMASSSIIEPSISLLYRHTTPDVTNGLDTPNTGGSWIHLQPGIGFTFADRWKISGFYEWPIIRKLTGTQLTTSARARLSVRYSFYFTP